MSIQIQSRVARQEEKAAGRVTWPVATCGVWKGKVSRPTSAHMIETFVMDMIPTPAPGSWAAAFPCMLWWRGRGL